MCARPFIDSLDFAENGREIKGELAISALPRLQDVLESDFGSLSYRVQGGLDEKGQSVLDIQADGLCHLRCQRCLGAVEYPFRISERVVLRQAAALEQQDDDEEMCDSILADAHLDVLALLEEEILLDLPIAPKHAWGSCQPAVGQEADTASSNPFAVLKSIKINK